MTPDLALTIRTMTKADLPVCLSFTQQVNWPHRDIDWQLHFELGHGSVIETVLPEDNRADDNQPTLRIVGCILWWDYPSLEVQNNAQGCATVGLVVVPDFMQGQGLGRKLMDTVMAQTGARHLQLVATVAGKRLYEQCGFTTRGSICQVQGEITTQPVLETDIAISEIDVSAAEQIMALDNQAFQANRQQLLTALMAKGTGVVARQQSKVIGYALMRESGRGETIGPIVASNDTVAQVLVASLLHNAKAFVRFDLTDHAEELKRWLITLGLQQVDQVNVMVKGEWLASRAEDYQIYGLASQAFG